MQTPPPLPLDRIRGRISAHLRQHYGLSAARVEFLPLGADANTAVFRVEAGDQVYFCKLRTGNFEPSSLAVPRFLHEQGVRQVIPPLLTLDGSLWQPLDTYACALYPFISGQDGWDAPLSAAQWREFGAALRQIHSLTLPEDLRALLRVEDYAPRWRSAVRQYQQRAERESFADPIAAQMAAELRNHRPAIEHMLARADALAAELRAQPRPVALCHYDIHAGNLLLTPGGALYIVDWDNPILAPIERDLMFIGGGVGDVWNTPGEESLFYQGYGPAQIDLPALAYYRYERILEDIAAYADQVLDSTDSAAERAQGLRYFASNFSPGGVLEIAQATDRRLG